MVRFAKHARKLDVMRPYLDRQAATGRSGIAAIGWPRNSSGSHQAVPGPRMVLVPRISSGVGRTVAYRVSTLYLWDEEFGPAFVKICSYLPCPIEIWLNGHEWTKQQGARAGIGFPALVNGFAATDDPVGLQAICDLRSAALRFGDPRVMALAGALAMGSSLIGGFSNKTIRPLIGGLLGEPYNQARCCSDLRRLRLKGLIRKVQHSNTYVLTADGQRFAIFCTKIGNRVLRLPMAADQIPAPLPVRQSLRTLERAVTLLGFGRGLAAGKVGR